MNGQIDSFGVTRKLQLLVVDDEANICDCIRLILTLQGHEVCTAQSGRKALELFAPNRFDVVLTDYSMPGMKGDEFVSEIKKIASDQPVIMITGLACTMKAPAGVDAFLSKPFMPEDLRIALAKVTNSCPIA